MSIHCGFSRRHLVAEVCAAKESLPLISELEKLKFDDKLSDKNAISINPLDVADSESDASDENSVPIWMRAKNGNKNSEKERRNNRPRNSRRDSDRKERRHSDRDMRDRDTREPQRSATQDTRNEPFWNDGVNEKRLVD